jgi:FkbM family methyltransferase
MTGDQESRSMSFLFEGPTPLDSQSFGTIIHIGAGAGDVINAYETLQWQQLVLIEGDPETVAELQADVGTRAHVRVVGEAVAAEAGPLAWHRYNLPSLNGPLRAGSLSTQYPRLRELATGGVTGAAIDAVLTAYAPSTDGNHLLVMDVPGQEDALLASVDGDLLRRFAWIVLRRCGGLGSTSMPGVIENLQREGFRVVDHGGDDDPLWPLTLMHFSSDTYRLRLMGEALTEAKAALEEQAAQTARQVEECARLEHALATERAAAAVLDHRVQDLTTAHNDALHQLANAVAKADAQRHEQAAEHTRQVELCERLEQSLAAAQARIEELQQQLTAVERVRDEEARQRLSLTTARDVQARLATQRLEQLQQAQAEVARLAQEAQANEEAARSALNDQTATLTGQLEAQRQLAQEQGAKLQALEQAKVADEAQSRQQALSLAQLKQEIEAQKAAHQQALTELHEQLQAATQTAMEQQQQINQRDKDRLVADRTAADQLRRVEEELTNARQSAMLSVKLQTLREADLRDLQARYQAAVAQQRSQHDLLNKLAQRLTVANQYFTELQLAQADSTAAASPKIKKPRRSRSVAIASASDRPAPAAPKKHTKRPDTEPASS